MTMNTECIDGQEPEVGLADIIDFFAEYRRWLLIGLLVGGIGIGGYQGIFGKYIAKGTLINNCNNAGGVCAIDFVGWQYLEKELGLLASKQVKGAAQAMDSWPLAEVDEASDAEGSGSFDPLILPLSRPAFWKKHIIPIFVISKEDVKNLAAPVSYGARKNGVTPGQAEGDPLAIVANSVIGLSVNLAGKSKDLAKSNTQKAMDFIVDGAVFIYSEGLIKSYNSQLELGLAGIERDVAKTRVDMVYQEKWVEHLNKMVGLHPKTLNEAGSVIQMGSKTELMSLETQIVVAENEVERIKANLSRLMDRQVELETLGQFVDRVTPLLSGNVEGRSVVEHFLAITRELKNSSAPDEQVRLAALGGIQADVTAIKVRFNQGFSEGKITVGRPLIKPILMGLAGGGFLAFMSAIGHRLLRRYREQKALPGGI